MATKESALKVSALAYAALKWPVVPLHESKDGVCLCERGVECEAPAKHPKNARGIEKASRDEVQIERWWKPWPNANIGVVTGHISGLWVLTVDAGAGFQTLAALEKEHGKLPHTPQVISGGTGRHFIFKNTSTEPLPEETLGPGVRILAKGRYVILPPSKHYLGQTYEWAPETPFPMTPLAAIPNWIIDSQRARLEAMSEKAHTKLDVDRGHSAPDIDDAVELFNRVNGKKVVPPWLPFPLATTVCPICPGLNSFKAHPSAPGKWICTSPQHTSGGKRSGNWHLGDLLDIEAEKLSMTRAKALEYYGYYGAAIKSEANKQRVERAASSDGEFDLTRSFATLCSMLESKFYGEKVFNERILGFNLMSGRPTLNQKPVDKFDVLDIRRRLEGFSDKRGDSLLFGVEDIYGALEIASRKFDYHPVVNYLTGLKWDGTKRLELMPSEILGIAPSSINKALIKRWMISAIARAFRPGCQVDSMLVLYGPEGIKKTSFFRELGGDWYQCTMIDPRNKDALHQIRAVWIYEWQEMEALQRARDSDAVKAFLTDRTDHYRPSHEKHVEDVPRNGVFCGTTNAKTFLSEMTGDRRFWPITCERMIDIPKLKEWRSQLWAEAYEQYKHGEQHYLTSDEARELAPTQESHKTHHPWRYKILDYIHDQSATQLTVPQLLAGPCDKSVGLWTTTDEKTVTAILRAIGWVEKPKTTDTITGRPKTIWVPKEAPAAVPVEPPPGPPQRTMFGEHPDDPGVDLDS